MMNWEVSQQAFVWMETFLGGAAIAVKAKKTAINARRRMIYDFMVGKNSGC
jgi:hypothetical protein